MADIAITIDGKNQAQVGAKKVNDALDKIEKQARTVQKLLKSIDMKVNISRSKAFDDIEKRIKSIHKLAGKPVTLKAMISKVGIKGSINDIQKLVRGYTAKSPIQLRAVLKLDRRSIRKQMKQAKDIAIRELTMPVKKVPLGGAGAAVPAGGQVPWDDPKGHPFAGMGQYPGPPPKSRAAEGTGGQYSVAEMDRLKRMTVSDEGWKWASKRLNDFENDLKKWWDRIDIDQNKKAAGRLGKVHDQVNEMRGTYQNINVAEAEAGGKRQYSEREKLIKQLEGYQKGWAGVEKKIKATSRATSFMNSGFAKFSIIMSGIAATLFVWQELMQLIRAVVGAGAKWISLLTTMSAAHEMNARQMGMFRTEAEALMREGFDTKTMETAFAELRKRGLSVNDATRQLSTTMELAKNPMVDMAEASKIAARGYTGLRDRILEANKSMAGTAEKTWNKMKAMLTSFFAKWYESREPAIIMYLEKFQTWISINEPAIMAFLDGIAMSINVVVEGLAVMITTLGSIIALMEKVPWKAATALYKMTHRKEIAATTPKGFSFEEWEDFGIKKEAEGWGPLETTYNKLQIQLKYYIKEHDLLNHKVKVLTERYEAIGMNDLRAGKLAEVKDQAAEAEKKVFALANAIGRMKDAAATEREGDDGTFKTIKEQLKAWEQYYKLVGRMSGLHKKLLKDEQDEVVANLQNTIGSTPARQAELRLQLKLDKRDVAGEMREMNQYFKAMGNLPVRVQGGKEVEKYHQMNVKFIEREVALMDFLTEAEKKVLTAKRIRAAWAAKEAPKLRAHEGFFGETGTMTDYLRKRKVGAAKTRRDEAVDKGVPQERADAQYAMDIVNIDKEAYAKRHEMHLAYWEATGKITGDHLSEDFAMHDRMVEALVDLYPNLEKEIRATYDKIAQDTMNKLHGPTLEAHRSLYEELGVMSEQHASMESVRIEQRIKYLKDLLGVENELVLAMERRLKMEQEATQLESQGAWKGWDDNQISDGFKAGTNRLQKDVDQWKNVSKSVSEAWQGAARDMEATFKSSFFDVMNLEFENLEDLALNVLKNIQKMLNEILWAIARAALIRSIGDSFGGGVKLQHGGWITEPIVGTGLKTGTTYTLGEKEPEYVTPKSKMGGPGGQGGGSLSINVPVAVDGGGETSGLEFRLRTEIEETVKTIVREEIR